MGNLPIQEKCCCSSAADDAPGAMDMVTPQTALSQGALTMERAANAFGGADPEEEEELDRKPQRRKGPDTPLRKQLLTAVKHDDAPSVLMYVADGANVIDMGEALRLAAHRGSASVVRELVAVGLSVNEGCPHTGFTSLQLASAGGHIVVCELLLDALADVHQPIGGSTALSLARKMGNVEVEEVIERHVASLLQEAGDGADDAAQYRRAHVLPRVSPVLSEAVMQALPARPVQEQEANGEVGIGSLGQLADSDAQGGQGTVVPLQEPVEVLPL